ncbi:hypothetical protein [Sphingomonas jatrophae]|nr:hypothetical protein [Sphingomonas jatrophae]
MAVLLAISLIALVAALAAGHAFEDVLLGIMAGGVTAITSVALLQGLGVRCEG